MNTLRLGPDQEYTARLSQSHNVHEIVTGTVFGLLALHDSSVTDFDYEGRRVRALALFGQPIKSSLRPWGGHISRDYHYAFTVEAGDESRAGIFVANAAIRDDGARTHRNRNTTARLYTTDGESQSTVVWRQDFDKGKPLTKLPMEEELSTALWLGLSRDDFVTQAFRHEVLEMGVSQPVTPMTNKFHQVVNLSLI